MQFFVIGKPRAILTKNSMNDFCVEVQKLLDEFVDIVVDELPHTLPHIKSISNHIDLIFSASLPNKASYRLTPQENE